MMRLKSKLLSLNASLPASSKVKVYSPRNCEELRIPFKADKIAKVVGRLARLPPPSLGFDSNEPLEIGRDSSKIITGVLVENDFKLSLMDAEDLREYAGLTTTVVMCKQRIRLSAAGADLIKWALEGTFGYIDDITPTLPIEKAKNQETIGDMNLHDNVRSDGMKEESECQSSTTYLVMGSVIVRRYNNGEIDLEWEGNMLNDGIADAVMSVLLAVESSPAAVKRKSDRNTPPLSIG